MEKKYHTITIKEYTDTSASFSTLSKRISELLTRFEIPDIPGNDMGTPKKWAEIYEVSPQSAGILRTQSLEIVGFWHCVAINQSTHKSIVLGNNVNRSLSSIEVLKLSPGLIANLYLVDLFILPEHQNIYTRRLMYTSFIDFLLDCSRNEVFFTRLTANITSESAKSLCQALGFKLVSLHQEHKIATPDGHLEPTKVFCLDICDSISQPLFEHSTELADRYTDFISSHRDADIEM